MIQIKVTSNKNLVGNIWGGAQELICEWVNTRPVILPQADQKIRFLRLQEANPKPIPTDSPTHSQRPLQAGAGRGELLLLPPHAALHAQVAPGRFAVVQQHLIFVLGTFPLAEVGHGVDQRVSPEGRQLLVALDVLLAQRHLALEARLDRRLPLSAATVAGNVDDQGALLGGKRKEKSPPSCSA